MEANATTTDAETVISATIRTILKMVPITFVRHRAESAEVFLSGRLATALGTIEVSMITEAERPDWIAIEAFGPGGVNAHRSTFWRNAGGEATITRIGNTDWPETLAHAGEILRG